MSVKETIAEIITIGDEILFGQITDTNSQWLGEKLTELGIKVKKNVSVGDEKIELLNIFKESSARADIIIITGGLGPTSDDITKPALCEYFQCGMVMDDKVLDHVTQFFTRLNRPMLEVNRLQAAIPENSYVLFNNSGTAPGLWIEQKGKVFIALPGVPYEMKDIMVSAGLPKLKEYFNPPVIVHKMIRTVGLGESFLAEAISEWEKDLPGFIKLAYLPSASMVKLRLTGTGDNEDYIQKTLAQEASKLYGLIGEYIYGEGDVELEEAVGNLLKEKGFTLSSAESCTGGNIAAILTSVPGSSSYFLGSVVAYHNDIKKNILKVKEDTLQKFGAVSENTVIEMSQNVRSLLNSDIGIATSGIAGPGGGTEEKPVGTIWIAYADNQKTITKKLQLTKSRALNIRITTTAVLNLIRENLNNYKD